MKLYKGWTDQVVVKEWEQDKFERNIANVGILNFKIGNARVQIAIFGCSKLSRA
jgi:hypothetical protein